MKISYAFNRARKFKVDPGKSVKNKIIGRESIKKIFIMRGNLINEKSKS